MKSNKAAIAAARKNPVPAIRNVIRPTEETVRVKPIQSPQTPVVEPSYTVPNKEDRSAIVTCLRTGTYYPGRMGTPTNWDEFEVECSGETIRLFRAVRSGYEGDDNWLSLECTDDEVEFDENDGDDRVGYSFESITPRCKMDFRHVSDIIEELKREGSVTLL